MSSSELWVFFIVMAAATFLTRALPFVAMQGLADRPWVHYLGQHLPPLLMAVLVIYGLMTLPFEGVGDGLLTAMSLAVTLCLHWLWRQPLLSIVGGTGLYVVGTQWRDWDSIERLVVPVQVMFLQVFQ